MRGTPCIDDCGLLVPDSHPPARATVWAAGEQVVVGIDEVGRGAWAGPVTVGAVVPGDAHLRGVRDSKELTPPRARARGRGGAQVGAWRSASGTRRTRSATSSA